MQFRTVENRHGNGEAVRAVSIGQGRIMRGVAGSAELAGRGVWREIQI